jgi:hypothetical protein
VSIGTRVPPSGSLQDKQTQVQHTSSGTLPSLSSSEYWNIKILDIFVWFICMQLTSDCGELSRSLPVIPSHHADILFTVLRWWMESSNTNWSLIGPQQAAVIGCPSGCRFSAQYSCHGGGCQKIQPLVQKMFWITLSTSVVQWLAMGWTTEVYFSEGQEIFCWHSWVHNSSGAHQPAVKWMPWGEVHHLSLCRADF